jgi:VRR-NUC domain
MPHPNDSCEHPNRSLLSPWELLRKYVCTDCSAVMTCACDHEIAAFILPHQAMRGRDQHTGDYVAVTHPLTSHVCHECRGEKLPVYPRAAHRGSASLVHRYYWHEIERATELEFLAWCKARGLPLFDQGNRPLFFQHRREHAGEYDEIQHSVVERIRAAHQKNPKYDFTRPSDTDVIKACNVTVESVEACYLTPSAGPVQVLHLDVTDPSQAVQVEEFVARRLRARGREVMFCESRPFQALYGSLMWLWAQSPSDPRLRVCMFGGRDGVGADERGLIWTQLPHDFGSPAHARRRKEALKSHVGMLPADTAEMLWAYDYWQEPSRPLRQYLWAYTDEDEQRGRTLIQILGARCVKMIMRYLAEAYWDRYLGWPDLVSWRETADGPQDAEFIEVKSSSDKLSDDQRAWIRDNHDHLQLPFRIVKVHRAQRLSVQPSA